MIKGIIFDLDGTLIDSMGIWHEIDEKFLLAHGIVPPDDISDIVKKMTIRESSEYFKDTFSLDMTWEEISEEIQKLARKAYYEEIPMKSGVIELLEFLDEIKIPYGVATATYPDMAVAALKRLGIFDKMKFVLTQNEVPTGKDSPDIFIKAAELLNIDNYKSCLVAEDSLHCISSAKGAGFSTIGLYDSASSGDWNKIQEISDITPENIEDIKYCLEIDEMSFEKLNDEIFVCKSPSHRFGTDAFLLTDFAGIKRKDKVCEFGTGCGIIPLILQKKARPELIYAVEIQKNAIIQFQRGLKKSKIYSEIIPICSDLNELDGKAPFDFFDAVICNPPYKANNAGLQSVTDSQKIARHEIKCSIDDICRSAYKLLKYGGKIFLCNRTERLADVIFAMKNSKLEPKRIKFVSKNPDSKPWLFLIEGRKGGGSFLQIEKQMYLYNENGEYTEEMKKIYE